MMHSQCAAMFRRGGASCFSTDLKPVAFFPRMNRRSGAGPQSVSKRATRAHSSGLTPDASSAIDTHDITDYSVYAFIR